MRLKAALEGDLKKHMKGEYRMAERAVTLGIREATNGLKMPMRRPGTFVRFRAAYGQYVAR